MTRCPVCGYEAVYDEMNLRCSHRPCPRYGELVDPNGGGTRTKAVAGGSEN